MHLMIAMVCMANTDINITKLPFFVHVNFEGMLRKLISVTTVHVINQASCSIYSGGIF